MKGKGFYVGIEVLNVKKCVKIPQICNTTDKITLDFPP